jgi:DNA-binding XRE family transcriptional regulator
MNIGTKIKNARIHADLTQEQVAESLGVSRQTISNWEKRRLTLTLSA